MSYEKVLPAIYEGRTSRLYAIKDNSEYLIIGRKDDITAGNGEKHDVIAGKGAICNQISNLLFQFLDHGTPRVTSHFVEALNDTETVIVKTNPAKLKVLVRNIATGGIVKRLPFHGGQVLSVPVIDLYYKDDASGYPFLNSSEAIALHILTNDHEFEQIKGWSLNINKSLKRLFDKCGIMLVDMKLEFGWNSDGFMRLIDEISPDTCRLWDAETGKSLDRDIYRNGGSPEEVLAAYQEVLRRLENVLNEDKDEDDDSNNSDD